MTCLGSFFLYFMEITKNMQVEMLINSITFRNLEKIHNHMDIEKPIIIVLKFDFLIWAFLTLGRSWTLLIYKLALRLRIISKKHDSSNVCPFCLSNFHLKFKMPLETFLRAFLHTFYMLKIVIWNLRTHCDFRYWHPFLT